MTHESDRMIRDPRVGRIDLEHSDVTARIISAFFGVYNVLGHCFVESVYEEAIAIDLREIGLRVERQRPVVVHFRGRAVGTFKADIIVNECVVLELKASRAISGAYEAQLLNYLRATELEVGLILNFGPRPSFKRLVFANARKGAQHHGAVHPDPFPRARGARGTSRQV